MHHLKKNIRLLLIPAALFFLAACSDRDDEPRVGPVENSRQTMIVFMPWCSDLYYYFEDNVTALRKSVAEGMLQEERLLVCIGKDTRAALLIELYGHNGQCISDTLLSYTDIDFTSRSGITKMLTDAHRLAPSPHQALIVGSHGWGWLPAGVNPARAKETSLFLSGHGAETCPTRWFGAMSDDGQIEVQTLAGAIADASLHMDYILFDDCYMSSVEVAYDLRHATDYIVACPTEIMAYGFPYDRCTRFLGSTPDYESLVTTFIDFYSTYKTPCATIGVTDCSRLEALAEAMREMNERFGEPDETLLAQIQTMDGLSPTLFYDLGDYCRHLCNEDETLRSRLDQLISQAVPYQGHTPYYYAAKSGSHRIDAFSGITTSAGSLSPFAASYASTAWYAATHSNSK